MFAKFHNTLQDSSYESRKKEKKKKREKLPTKSPIDYSDLTTRCNWYSLLRHEDNAHFPTATLPTLPFTTKLQARYSWLRGRKNRPRESVVQSGKRSIPIDHAVLIERSRPRVHAKSNRHIQSRRFIHWKPIPADWYLRQWTRLVSHFQGRRVSLSLSTRSLSSLPILARVCSHHCQSKDANERDPSSSNNLFPSWSSRNPRHTISYVPWWIPSLLASCESRGIEACTRLSDPDGQVVGPTTSRSRPGRGPTVASGPQQHLWSGLLRGPIWDSSPRSSCNNVDTDPSSFSSFSFSPLFLGLFAPGPRQRILEFKLDASGPNRPDSDTPLILKSSFLPLYGSDLWLSTGIPLQGKLISVQPFFFYVTFVIRRTSGLLDRLQMRSLVLDNENRECRIVSEVWWKRVILRPWPRSSIPMDARTELRRLSTIKLLQLA